VAIAAFAALASSCTGQHHNAAPSRPLEGATAVAVPRARVGYWLVRVDGSIRAFGDASGDVSLGARRLNRPVVCVASTPSGRGYWLVAADGGVFAFGDARSYGSAASVPLERPVVDMAATRTGHGYWLLTANGTVIAFGDAGAYGSLRDHAPTNPVVGIASTPSGRGYWLVRADGQVFAFGDAHSYSPSRAFHFNRPIIGISPSPTGRGYRLAAADGGVFAFGDARFYGSAAALPGSRSIVAFATTPTGAGYWLTGADGRVYAYGDAHPSRGGTSQAVLGMAGLGEAGVCDATSRPPDLTTLPGAPRGEGRWTPSARMVGGEPVIYTTTLTARAGLPAAGLAWIATNRAVFRLYAGRHQPPGTFLYSGFVDPAQQRSLLATFSAGFKVDASEGGWSAYGHTAIPLRDGAASLIIRSDGTATVGMWGRDAIAGPHVVAVRQNLQLLIDGGRPAADLAPRSWGATFRSTPATWRTGLGVDAQGNLVYAIGADLLPSDLGHLLLAAGCQRAMQLDINRVVSFATFAAASPGSQIVGTNLLPTINFTPNRYLQPSGRDFISVSSA
jgi:hypothetical protein